jgi:hyperosmotically inducible protein
MSPGTKPGDAHSSASDMRVTAAVKLHLWTAAEVPSSDISVDTNDGVVTLFGVVPTAAIRHAAEVEAAKVSGVVSVENGLEVVGSADQQRVEKRDGDIAKDLALAMKANESFGGVKTSVKNGTVHLTGTVATGWDVLHAVRCARRVAGVRGVVDGLKVEEKRQPLRQN